MKNYRLILILCILLFLGVLMNTISIIQEYYFIKNRPVCLGIEPTRVIVVETDDSGNITVEVK